MTPNRVNSMPFRTVGGTVPALALPAAALTGSGMKDGTTIGGVDPSIHTNDWNHHEAY